MTQDEQHVVTLLQHLDKNMINPFRPDDHTENVLVNISTGMLVTTKVGLGLHASLLTLDYRTNETFHEKSTLTKTKLVSCNRRDRVLVMDETKLGSCNQRN